MTDPDPLGMIRSLAWNEPPGERGPRCLDDETIAAFADDGLDVEARGKAMTHLAECGYCRKSLVSLARALGDRAVAAATEPARSLRRWLIGFAVPTAAAAVFLIAVLGRDGRVGEPSPGHRAPEVTAADQPVAITPLGTVPEPEVLRWGTVGGTDRYRVTLYHADGHVLYERELADTAAALPDSIRLTPGERYLWKVEARTGWDRWSSSRLFEFSVARSAVR